ncbi:phytoene dehydrogenase-like protein [Zhihengliuella flava]|uniref:Phytoene dehydrogenase-like protein n=1 Tax=Zhihengliuella flava TaxID=1285193 RepID=A0A931DBV1_9MICC|nr:phytoene dehydrogenase-like protein [Zhihengliuella flava]
MAGVQRSPASWCGSGDDAGGGRVVTADAAVVGSGPNGLAAALTLARAGWRVRVYEAAAHLGGASATQRVDGALHDLGSAVHPTAAVSPFFGQVGLTDAVDFVTPEISYAHPLGAGPSGGAASVLIFRDYERTLESLGRQSAAARAYARVVGPLAAEGPALGRLFLGDPLATRGACLWQERTTALRLARSLAAAYQPHMPLEVSAALEGVRAHIPGGSYSPAATVAGLFLSALAHHGWPVPVGGSGAIIAALAAQIEDLCGDGWYELGREVTDPHELSEPVVLWAAAPEALAGAPAPARGPGSAVVHLTTDAPIPWADPRLARAGTVHLGGPAAALRRSERAAARRFDPANPYVLLSQPSQFDATRAPAGTHVLWAYVHVPAGAGLTDLGGEDAVIGAVTRQIERQAPGFADTVTRAWVRSPRELVRGNPALIGGDISGGLTGVGGMAYRLRRTASGSSAGGAYLASSSAWPGPAVHGMAGHLAAVRALADAA